MVDFLVMCPAVPAIIRNLILGQYARCFTYGAGALRKGHSPGGEGYLLVGAAAVSGAPDTASLPASVESQWESFFAARGGYFSGGPGQ